MDLRVEQGVKASQVDARAPVLRYFERDGDAVDARQGIHEKVEVLARVRPVGCQAKDPSYALESKPLEKVGHA